MDYYGNLMGLFGLVWCNECMAFHPPELGFGGRMGGMGGMGGFGGFPGPFSGGGMGGLPPTITPISPPFGGGGGMGGLPPTMTPIPPPFGGGGGMGGGMGGPPGFQSPFPGFTEDDFDFNDDDDPGSGPGGGGGGEFGPPFDGRGGGWPPQQPTSQPPQIPIQNPTGSTPAMPPPAPDAPRSSGGRGRGADYSQSTKPPEGGITDHRSIEVPQLPPPNPANRHQPVYNKQETFLRNDILQGAGRHPTAPQYPQRLNRMSPDASTFTPEQASARAFVEMCMITIRWNELGEDLYAVHKKKPLTATLLTHLKYFLKTVLPHLQANGDVPPGDYCKIRALLDWIADHTDSMGTMMTQTYGWGKGRGHARESGWWRKEAVGFPEGAGVQDILEGKTI